MARLGGVSALARAQLIPTLFAAPLAPLVMAFGQTRIFFKRNLFEISVKLPLVVIGALRFGFLGVVVARGISETATVCFCMLVVRRLLGVSVRDQVFTAWRSIISVLAMSGVLLIVLPHLTQSTDTLTLAAGTLLAIFLAAGTYCAVLFSLWIAAGGPHGIEALVANKFKALLHTRQQVPAEVTK